MAERVAKAQNAVNAWRIANEEARTAEAQLWTAWDEYLAHRGPPVPVEQEEEVARLRAEANRLLAEANRLLKEAISAFNQP
jgi:hypothetical protein